MNREPGRPDHITGALNSHGYAIGETPFGYTDPNDQVYKNLVMYGGLPKPRKADLEAELLVLQAEWDVENAPCRLARKAAYPSKEDQLDMLFHDQENGTTVWVDTLRAIKAKYPKPDAIVKK